MIHNNKYHSPKRQYAADASARYHLTKVFFTTQDGLISSPHRWAAAKAHHEADEETPRNKAVAGEEATKHEAATPDEVALHNAAEEAAHTRRAA